MVKHNAWILHVPTNLHLLHKLHTTTWNVYRYFENKHFILWLLWEPTTMDKTWKHSGIILSIVPIQLRKKCFDPDTKFRKEGRINLLNTIEKTTNALDFDAITTMTMGDDEGAKNKEHVDDRISESNMKTSSKYTTNKNVSQLNVHIIWQCIEWKWTRVEHIHSRNNCWII